MSTYSSKVVEYQSTWLRCVGTDSGKTGRSFTSRIFTYHEKHLRYYGIGQNYGNWIFQSTFSTIFSYHGRGAVFPLSSSFCLYHFHSPVLQFYNRCKQPIPTSAIRSIHVSTMWSGCLGLKINTSKSANKQRYTWRTGSNKRFGTDYRVSTTRGHVRSQSIQRRSVNFMRTCF